MRALLGVTFISLICGGCSFSYQLGSMLESRNAAGGGDVTGSITPASTHARKDDDLALARMAAAEVLSRGKKNSSQTWENPSTGARGTVTPIADSYTQDGFTCQDFLASYVKGASEEWMRGEACRQHRGVWEVRNLKPWKQA